MGCGSSNQTHPSPKSPMKSNYKPKLMLVPNGETINSEIKQIHYYSLNGCQLEGSIDLPGEGKVIQSGFTVAAHPREPVLFITGEHKGDKEEIVHGVWTVNITTGETKHITYLPSKIIPYLSIVTCEKDDKNFLYIFGRTGLCQRLDILSDKLEAMPKYMTFSDKIDYIMCIQNTLYVIGDGKLVKLDPKLDANEERHTVLSSKVPEGQYTVVGDQIAVINKDSLTISKCTLPNGNFETIPDLDTAVFKKCISVVGIGSGYLYLTESLGSKESVSVIEYDLSKNRAATAGFIEKCPADHKILICWA